MTLYLQLNGAIYMSQFLTGLLNDMCLGHQHVLMLPNLDCTPHLHLVVTNYAYSFTFVPWIPIPPILLMLYTSHGGIF